MANTIADYLDELRVLLRGKVSEPDIDSVLQESEVHLTELSEELGSEAKAIEKFGAVNLFAENVIKGFKGPNTWQASRWPIAILLVGLLLLVPLGDSYGPKGPIVVGGFYLRTLDLYALTLLAFAFACFKARKLIPLQIAFFVVVMAGVGTFSFVRYSIPFTQVTGLPQGHATKSQMLRTGPELKPLGATTKSDLTLANNNLKELDAAAAAFVELRRESRESFMITTGSLNSASSMPSDPDPSAYVYQVDGSLKQPDLALRFDRAEASMREELSNLSMSRDLPHHFPTPDWFMAKGQPELQLVPGHVGPIRIMRGETGKPTEKEFSVEGLQAALDRWTPTEVYSIRSELDSRVKEDQSVLDGIRVAATESYRQRLAASAVREIGVIPILFARFFFINILSWGIAVGFYRLRRFLARIRIQIVN